MVTRRLMVNLCQRAATTKKATTKTRVVPTEELKVVTATKTAGTADDDEWESGPSVRKATAAELKAVQVPTLKLLYVEN